MSMRSASLNNRVSNQGWVAPTAHVESLYIQHNYGRLENEDPR